MQQGQSSKGASLKAYAQLWAATPPETSRFLLGDALGHTFHQRNFFTPQANGEMGDLSLWVTLTSSLEGL